MVSLRQVRSVLAVVDCGGINRAAEQLCLSPSSVSAQLRDLSAVLGVSLFEPAGRGLVLSAAGRQLLPKFQRLIALSEDVVAQAQALVSEPSGELRLYAPSSMCIYRLPALIEKLQPRAPGVELNLRHDPFDYREGLATRSIEAAIVVNDKPEPGCEHCLIASESVVYVAHPSLIRDRRMRPKQLAECALITTESGCSYRAAAERHFKAEGLRLQPRQCFSNVEVIRRCLLAKMGVGLLPRCVVEEDLQQGRLAVQRVVGAPYRFNSSVVWPSTAEVSPRLAAFLAVVRERAQHQ